MRREGKVICTARGTHKKRELASYAVDDTMFSLFHLQPVVVGDGATHYVRGQSNGLRRVRVRCPSCSSDYQFTSEVFHAFLLMDLPGGATRRDLSRLQAASSGF